MSLEFYASIGAALFPIPTGQKNPTGIVGSFVTDCSTDPEQWKRWAAENPGCNFGIVAGASALIIADIDIKSGRDGAWAAWCELCKSWGIPVAQPHCQSASGGWHCYFKVPDDIDPQTLRQPDAVKGIVNIRAGHGYAVAAGSVVDDQDYVLLSDAPPYPAPTALVEHCTRKATTAPSAKVGTYDLADTAMLLRWLNERDAFADYQPWYSAGMALRLAFGDAGLDLWRITHNETVTPEVERTKWQSFATEPTEGCQTINSLFATAHAIGWRGSVRPTAAAMFDGIAPSIVAPQAGQGMTASVDLLMSSAAFVASFVTPDPLVEDVLLKRFCYSLTGQTGSGKTSMSLRVAAHAAIGRPLGGRFVAKGTVIYFAGENPTDVQMRWLATCREMGIDPDTVDVHFVSGARSLVEIVEQIRQEVIRKGLTPVLVVVDTSAAYFGGDEENSNVQLGDHARQLRSLTTLPGGPCVLVNCHPTKGATDDGLVPRGGGAFLNEMDGNIAVRRHDRLIAASAFGKFRGPEFSPLSFELRTVTHPRLKDTRGKNVPTVIAEPINDDSRAALERMEHRDADLVLRAIDARPGATVTDYARQLDWKLRDGSPNHAKVRRLCLSLQKQKLVEEVRKLWRLTVKGQKELNAMDAAGATEATEA